MTFTPVFDNRTCSIGTASTVEVSHLEIILSNSSLMPIYEQITSQIKAISRLYLKNINLALPKGMIMGLIGDNGASKSTLINLILNEQIIYIYRIFYNCHETIEWIAINKKGYRNFHSL